MFICLKNIKYKIKFLIITFVALNFLYFVYQDNFKTRSEWKKILIWTDFFRSKNVWKKIFGRITRGECEESRCLFTMNKNELKHVDAVLFNAFNLREKRKTSWPLNQHIFPLPDRRENYEKIFIFYSMEPPSRLQYSYLKNLSNYFNWTMSYRKDSDIVEPFGVVRKRSVKKNPDDVNYTSDEDLKKKLFSIWIASHCPKPRLAREHFVRHLKRFIKVDIKGKCGRKHDNDVGTKIYGKKIGESKTEKLISNYVFYLALENSLCKDYVTEKIFKAWKLGAIPVVFGSANYSSFAPPKSYIDYRDFESIFHLTEYLKKVSTHSNLYNEYLRWNENYEIELGSPYNSMVCDLCKKLHEDETQRVDQFYSSISNWFISEAKCVKTANYKVK